MMSFNKIVLITLLLAITQSAVAQAAGPKCIDEDGEIVSSQFKEGLECRNEKDTLTLSLQFYYVGDDIDCASTATLRRLGDGPGSSKNDFAGLVTSWRGLNATGYSFGGSGEVKFKGKADVDGNRKAVLTLGRESLSVQCKVVTERGE